MRKKKKKKKKKGERSSDTLAVCIQSFFNVTRPSSITLLSLIQYENVHDSVSNLISMSDNVKGKRNIISNQSLTFYNEGIKKEMTRQEYKISRLVENSL